MTSTHTAPYDNPFTRQFLSGYLVDHFLYKQRTLYYALESIERWIPEHSSATRRKVARWIFQNLRWIQPRVLKHLDEVDPEACAHSIRLEIRAALFQSIETLFELIFSLEPRNGKIDNRHMWFFLSTSPWRDNLKRIGKIAKGDTAFLDRQVVAGRDFVVPFSQYVFYFGLTNPSLLISISQSLDAIKDFLVLFAKEYTDRGEYNAFKHALRIFPTLRKIEIGRHGTDKPGVTLDLKNSMTFLTQADGAISFNTQSLDTERDMRMGQVCAYLISNIVRSRRARFDKVLEGHLHTFTAESLSSATERRKDWAQFTFSLKEVSGPPEGGSHRAGA